MKTTVVKIETKDIANQVNLTKAIASQILKTTRNRDKKRKAERLLAVCHNAKPTREDFKRMTIGLYRLAL